jgi:hypothetical protein
MLGKLESFSKLSCEVEESHTKIIKVVHIYLTDMKTSLEEALEPSSQLNRLIEKVVGTIN